MLKQKIKLEAYFVKNSYIALLCKIMKYYLRWVGIKLIQLNKQMHNVCFDFTSQVDIELDHPLTSLGALKINP